MRILSALIITYCCGCVVPENLNEECENLRTLGKSISSDITVQIGSKKSPWYNNNCRRLSRRHVENWQSRQRSHSRKILSSRGHRTNVAGHRTRGHKLRMSSTVHLAPHAHRKTKNVAAREDDETEDESNDEEHAEHAESENWDDWGNWGDWTTCTVTCGSGRQVRWRHCTSEKCPIQGLKRAQMKTCHCKDCPPKGGMFSWFGIRSQRQLQ